MNRVCRLVVLMLLAGLIAAGCSRDPRTAAQEFIASGDRYLAAGRSREAAIEYRNALRHQPRLAEAHFRLGAAQERLGMSGAALQSFARAAELDDRHADAHLRAAALMLGAARFKEARIHAEAVLRHYPAHARAVLTLAATSAGLGDVAAAERHVQAALSADPASADAWMTRANVDWATGHVGDTLAALEHASTLAPGRADVRRALATFHLASGDVAKAEVEFRALAKSSVAGRLALAQFLNATRRHDEAARVLSGIPVNEETGRPVRIALHLAKAESLIEDAARIGQAQAEVERALKLDPASAKAHLILGRVLVARGDLAAAQQAFAKAIQVAPRMIPAYLELARVLMGRGEFAPAVRVARAAVAVTPNPDVVIVLAQALRASRDVDGAREVMTKAIAGAPNVARLHAELGDVELSAGRIPAARASFERAAALSEDAGLRGLIFTDIADRRLDAARRRVDLALQKDPRNVDLIVLSAQVAFAADDSASARVQLDRAVDLEPGSVERHVTLAKASFASGDADTALREYEWLASRGLLESDPWTAIGMIKRARADVAGARAAYEKALAIDARDGVAANNLAVLYAEGRRVEDALRLARVADGELRGRPEALDTLGWICHLNGLHFEAVRLLKQAVAKDPDNTTYRHHLTVAQQKASETSKD
jgi:tetratricopeptide (TPR) repeat protein